MTEAAAERHLRATPRAFTAGSVLLFYSEVFADLASEPEQDGDEMSRRQYATVEQALHVFGCGVDAACPRRWGEVDMLKHLADHFKAARLAKGMTVEGLARLVGYRDSRKVAARIGRFEQGGTGKGELLSRLAVQRSRYQRTQSTNYFGKTFRRDSRRGPWSEQDAGGTPFLLTLNRVVLPSGDDDPAAPLAAGADAVAAAAVAQQAHPLWRQQGLRVPRKQRKKRRLGSSANS